MSVRARLTLWYGGSLLLLVAAFSAGVFYFVRDRLLAQTRHELDEAYERVEATCRHDPGELYELEKHGGLAFFEVRGVYRTARWGEVGPSFGFRRGTVGTLEIAVAYDETSARGALRTLGFVLLLGLPIVAALAVGGGWLLAGRLLAPVGAMAEKAREITADHLSERLPVGNPADEFGRLAGVFNETLARLGSAFEQLRRFTADASHELRTPLTAIRSTGEVALQSPRDPAFYRDVIGSMLEECDRLSRLVESLLVLTRADAASLKAAKERVDLAALARSCADTLRVLAEEKGQTLTFEGDGAHADADPRLLRQAVLNVIDNAVKYTPLGGSIRVRVDRPARIQVIDNGPGIPSGHQARIFERFYRIDPSRSDGGAGLGLAIAKWAVELNGGTISVESREGCGSTFTISLIPPRSPEGR